METDREVDAASLAAFRALFGLLMAGAAVRFWAKGWIGALYVEPAFHFTYWGFDWIRPLPGWGMYAVFAGLIVTALAVALGLLYRWAIALFFVLFTYVELLDQATYLNHYYLVSLLALLMCFMPLGRSFSVDARGQGALRAPRWCLWTLRAQLGLVYVFAGIAKLNADWLIEAEPLSTWLAARSELPGLGALAAIDGFAHVMSWGGAVFDLTVPFALLHRRTRPFAYAGVVGFHLVTGVMFQLGMFPWIMALLTPIFFSPSWPRRLWASLPRGAPRPSRTLPRWGAWALAGWFAIQLALPLRHHAYPGQLLWTEEGLRWSWHVMIVEKSGHLELTARDRVTGERWPIDPSEDLTFAQRRMMATSPDMLLRYAAHVRERWAARGRDVAVHADAWVAMNGRRSAPLVDPEIDLAAQPDDLAPRAWVTRRPAP